MRHLVWILGALIACDGEAPEEPEPEPEPIAAPEPEPAVADAEALALSGRHKDAAAASGASPDLVARESARASGEASWLSVHSALRGGDARGALALASGSDARTALAVLGGSKAPADAGPLTAYARGGGAPAEDVAGWEAALARAAVLHARGDAAGAAAEAEAAVAQAPIEANLWRAGAGLGSAEERIAWARAAAEAAIAAADGSALLASCSLLTGLHGSVLSVDQALADVRALHDKVVAEHGALAAGASGVALARAAMSAGRPIQAQEAAAAARLALEGDPAVSRAAWLEGWAAYQLGELEAIASARDAASGAHQQALAVLVELAQGLPPSVAGVLPSEGLSDRELAYLNVEAALLAPEASAERLAAAVAAADRTQDMALRVYTRLAQEASARANNAPEAAAMRAALRGLFGDRLPAHLAAELAVRGLIDGEPLGAVPGDAAVFGIWSALAAGTAVEVPEGSWHRGLASWSQGRAAVRAGKEDAAVSLNAALGDLPVHRQGLLSLGTALDGSQGIGVGADLAALGDASTDATLGAALAAHELAHRLKEAQDDVALGRDMTAGMPSERRRELRAAAARARVEVLLFHLGASFPDDMLAAVAEAERAAASEEPFQRSVSTPGTPLEDLRDRLAGACVVSYAEVDGRISGLVVAPAAGQLTDLGPAAELTALTEQYRDQLIASRDLRALSDHTIGDALRTRLVDPFTDTLIGFGRYLVIAPSELMSISLTALPEHQTGYRFLADIRTITQGSSLRMMMLPEREVTSYSPEFLGMGEAAEPEYIVIEAPEDTLTEDEPTEDAPTEDAPAEEPAPEPERRVIPGSEIPRDLGSASRHFGQDFREVFIGDAATEGAYQDHAPTARHLFIADLPPSSDGGFQFADGELSLSEVRAQPMVAQVVFISAPAPQELQAHRVRAFLEAGASAVLVTNWEIPERQLNMLVSGFYESLNRDREPVLALADARQSMLRDFRADDPDFTDNPAIWGAVMLYGGY